MKKLLLLFMVLSATISLYAVEADFTYQGVNYTVLDEDAKTGSSRKYGAFVKTERMKC